MKNRLTGIIFIILGGVLAAGPRTIFPVCEVHMDMVMTCNWTAQAELGIGIVIALLGVLLVVIRSNQVKIGLSLGIILNGLLSILVPTVIIGVCEGKHMACHSLTLPVLVIIGSIIVIIAGIYSWYLNPKKPKEVVKL